MLVQKLFDLLQAIVNLSSSDTMPPVETFRIWQVSDPKIKYAEPMGQLVLEVSVVIY